MSEITLTEQAQAWGRIGPVLPVEITSDSTKGFRGTHKRPLLAHGHNDATSDPASVAALPWGRADGIGLALAEPGLVVVDIDTADGHSDDGYATLAQLEAEHGRLPDAPTVLTASGGEHRYFTAPGMRGRSGVAPGIDVKGADGWVVVAGEITWPDGHTGRWTSESSADILDGAEPPPLPDWFADLIGRGASNGTGNRGPWQPLDRDALLGPDLAALEALERLGGHAAHQRGDGSVGLTRPGKTAGISATIGYLGPGTAKVWSGNWPPLAEGVYDADRLVAVAETGTDPGNDQGDGAGDGDEADTGKKKSAATVLVELARDRYRLCADADGTPYAVERGGPPVALTYRGGRLGMRAALADAYMAATGKVASASALADALTTLEGAAARSEPTPTALRVAEAAGDIVVDLGRSDGRSVEVKNGAWTLTDDPPVTWRRTALTGELPEPTSGGDLAELRGLLNVSERTWPLLVGYLVGMLFPNIPHPVLLLHGLQGTGKTTAARLIASVMDASPVPTRTAPRDIESWAVAASGSWVVAIDNVGTIAAWFSDALCRACTGDGVVKRQLYTDGDLAVLAYRRCVLLTAIDAGALRGDLADRLVRVELDRIEAGDRKAEGDLDAAWSKLHPRLLGALLSLVAQVHQALPTVELGSMPRMADYARVLAAVDQVTGMDTLARYQALGAELAIDVVDDDPVASRVAALARKDTSWSGTATELWRALTDDDVPKDWPKGGRGLSGRLRRSAPALRETGVLVEFPDPGTNNSRDRIIHVTNQEKG